MFYTFYIMYYLLYIIYFLYIYIYCISYMLYIVYTYTLIYIYTHIHIFLYKYTCIYLSISWISLKSSICRKRWHAAMGLARALLNGRPIGTRRGPRPWRKSQKNGGWMVISWEILRNLEISWDFPFFLILGDVGDFLRFSRIFWETETFGDFLIFES